MKGSGPGALRRRQLKQVIAAFVVVGSIVPLTASAGASSSPYPATLTLQRGLTMSEYGHALPWGTKLTAKQSQSVQLRSTDLAYRWAVWGKLGGPEYPVRDVDLNDILYAGSRWTAAGPQLATDWAGGGIYYITRVIAVSASAVVMVSNAVIDVTVDAGHHWFQYVNGADDWNITGNAASPGAIEIRVGPASFASLPKDSYAVYRLDLLHLRWRRITQSLS